MKRAALWIQSVEPEHLASGIPTTVYCSLRTYVMTRFLSHVCILSRFWSHVCILSLEPVCEYKLSKKKFEISNPTGHNFLFMFANENQPAVVAKSLLM